MKLRHYCIAVGLVAVSLSFSLELKAQSALHFTFDNVEVTDGTPAYLEFDVMAAASAADTRLGDTQVYFNYNAAGFGETVVVAEKISVTKGALLEGELIPGDPMFALYEIVNVVDNTHSKVAITNGYLFDGAPGNANVVPLSPTQLVHVSIEIADPSETADLAFDQSLMLNQQYVSNNSDTFAPVVAEDFVSIALSSGTVGVHEYFGEMEIPAEGYHLSANYPNPFNPTTRFVLGVGQKQHVTVDAFDVLGIRVARLYDGELTPNTSNEFVFDGRHLSSGIYFLMVSGQTFTASRAITMIK